MVQFSVPLPVSFMRELDTLAKKEKKRASALAQEVLQVWILSQREKERQSAIRHQAAEQENRVAMLYGGSLQDAEGY
jgi:predicted transcriptional regulator